MVLPPKNNFTYIIIINCTDGPTSSKLNFALDMRQKRNRPVCWSQPAHSCHRCLSKWSIRGYEKKPRYYFLLLKCTAFFSTSCNHTWQSIKDYMTPACMTTINKCYDLFLFLFFFFRGKIIWMNYPVLHLQHFKTKPQREPNLWSRHTYCT